MSFAARFMLVLGAGGFLGLALGAGVLIWRGGHTALVFGQPTAERRAQQDLPRSDDPVWAVLTTTRINEDAGKGAFSAVFPPAVSALAGKEISISGFMLPLEARSETDHFLLSKYTPVCAFCPPGRPNEVIEVRSTGPVYPDTAQVTVTGRFSLQRDGGAGLFFRMDGAEVSG